MAYIKCCTVKEKNKLNPVKATQRISNNTEVITINDCEIAAAFICATGDTGNVNMTASNSTILAQDGGLYNYNVRPKLYCWSLIVKKSGNSAIKINISGTEAMGIYQCYIYKIL